MAFHGVETKSRVETFVSTFGDATGWKFNSSPVKIGRIPKGKDRLPTIIFQGRALGELLNFGGVDILGCLLQIGVVVSMSFAMKAMLRIPGSIR